MSNPEYTRIVTQSGLADAIMGNRQRVAQIVENNFQRDGRMRPEVVQLLIPQIPYGWEAAGSLATGQLTRRHRVLQPGAVVRIDAYVSTPPSGASTVITLTRQSPVLGLTTLATVSIPAGQTYGGSAIPDGDIPAGTWLGISITTAAGAAGLSVTAAFQGGA